MEGMEGGEKVEKGEEKGEEKGDFVPPEFPEIDIVVPPAFNEQAFLAQFDLDNVDYEVRFD